MHFQDSLLCKWKQGEKRKCPYHGTSDNQRNYRTVQLQAERYQGYVFSLNIHKSVIFLQYSFPKSLIRDFFYPQSSFANSDWG